MEGDGDEEWGMGHGEGAVSVWCLRGKWVLSPTLPPPLHPRSARPSCESRERRGSDSVSITSISVREAIEARHPTVLQKTSLLQRIKRFCGIRPKQEPRKWSAQHYVG